MGKLGADVWVGEAGREELGGTSGGNWWREKANGDNKQIYFFNV